VYSLGERDGAVQALREELAFVREPVLLPAQTAALVHHVRHVRRGGGDRGVAQ
jgi:hypothetical protein